MTKQMNQVKPEAPQGQTGVRQFLIMAGCLLASLGLLFWKALLPGYTVFSNDGPLGAVYAESGDLLGAFFGAWQNLNWLGGAAPNAMPDITQMLGLICGPLLFTKIFAPFAACFVGLSAWVCFRAWKFTPAACLLGGLAVGLNSDFIATACWGVAAQPIAFGLDFLALAALADQTSPRRWLRVILAGFAVGLTIMEAFDIGAMFSLFVGAYALFHAVVADGSPRQRIARGAGRLVLVAVCAGCVAAAALTSLIQTQIKDVADMGQDAASKARRWAGATQWSLPKQETLGVAVPGIFGFGMFTPKDMAAFGEHFQDGAYWGMVGSDAAWDRWFAGGKKGPPPQAMARFSGGGIYAGVLVLIVAAWAAAQSFRKKDSVFSAEDRKLIWFWLAVAFGSLLLAYGRFAPFYQILYALPYASTFRNPAKFIHVVEWALLIVFGYGLNGLTQRYLAGSDPAAPGLGAQLKVWWSKVTTFDRRWVIGSAVTLGAALFAWFLYDHARERLALYIQMVGFDANTSGPMADSSIRQVGWAVLFLALGLTATILVISGYFKGPRARFGVGLLGLLLVADLAASDVPYIVVWDYVQKYASNPIIDQLREPNTHPYEQRVAILPFPPRDQESARFHQLYEVEWKQHHWQYYNIQSLDIIMNPRAPEAFVAFETAMQPTADALYRLVRRWQLTNTRFLLGAAGYVEVLNQQLDPAKRRFRVVTPFAVEPKPGIGTYTKLEELTAVPNSTGPMALIEFTGALPRAKLYSDWQVNTNDQQTLSQLASAAFDPEQTVLVSDALVPPKQGPGTNAPGSVNIVSYAPKRIQLQAKATAPAVLLLNDKHDSNWSVFVDGKPAPLLRCNFLMRGVQVPAGEHTVVFSFAPPFRMFYVSLAGILIGLGLLGFLAFTKPAEK